MDSALHERIVAIPSRANDMTFATVSQDGYRQATTVGYFGTGRTRRRPTLSPSMTRSR